VFLIALNLSTHLCANWHINRIALLYVTYYVSTTAMLNAAVRYNYQRIQL